MNIAILSASVRRGRNSHRVTLYLKQYILDHNIGTVDVIDLAACNFPLFDERLQYMPEPSEGVLDFQRRINAADGVIIVTPEYNGGYPASLKNVIDLLYKEWKRKPIAIASVSDGPYAGTQVVTSLAFSLWKIGALLVPSMFRVANVDDTYKEDGTVKDKPATDKFAGRFIDELVWCISAKRKMDEG